MSDEPAIALRRFGVAFGPQVVLANVTLEVPRIGAFVLVGPPSGGKSTLLRTLAGLNDPQPALRTWGEALVAGRPLADSVRPAIVVQHARLLVSSVHENLVSALPDRSSLSRLEQLDRIRGVLDRLRESALEEHLSAPVLELPLARQRRLAIVRAMLSGAGTVLVDEPMSGLPEDDCADVIALLRRVGEEHAVLVTTHHQGHARALGGRFALLAGGRIRETGETVAFLDGPKTEVGRQWLASGHCRVPSPTARPEDLAEGIARPTPLPESMQRALASAHEPRGMFWLLADRLAGMPRPGVVSELEHDLDGLRSLGVTGLITLEEERTVSEERLALYGIRAEHEPIPDMAAPSTEQAVRLCRRLDVLVDGGQRVVVHCLAGLGRTGTVLAMYAIWRGTSAVDAIELVRTLRPRTIQSDEQVRFLEGFERYVAERPDPSER
ncbi:MAG: ATP-binding cassette domain-containing protein [Sandaracinus sp.]|nr:ATP-binding cassette domain-containing protein [Sandaracinus sp.]MCB9636033.1 ATP-binding cassette domain-containing protein [Sandaracinus sp.]